MFLLNFCNKFYLAFITTFLLGGLEATYNALASIVIATDYKGRLEAFSIFKQYQSVLACVPAFMIIWMNDLSFMVTMSVIVFVLNLLLLM